jgi:hypothetical protein
MYDYAREGLLPDHSVYSPYGEWYAFNRILSYGSDGRANTMVSRVLDLAVSQNRLEELTGQIEAARKKFPNWAAGKALLALTYCRSGRYDDCKKLVHEVIDLSKDETITNTVLWVIGSELENHGATRDLAVALYEGCLTTRADNPYTFLQLDSSPIKRLVNLYTREGHKEDARRVLQEFLKPRDFSNYPEEYIQQLRVAGQTAAARELIELGYIADAIPIYNEAQTAAEAIPEDGPYYYVDRDSLLQQIRDGLNQALAGVSGEDLVRSLPQFLDRPAGAGKTDSDQGKDGKQAENQAAKKPDTLVDLVVLVYPRALDKSAIRSLFDESIQASAKGPERLAELEKQLEKLRQSNSGDLSVHIASSLIALAGGSNDRIKEALERLNQAVARTPLEPLPAGTRANARQRALALHQIPLWLVARACWQKKEWKPAGDTLAAVGLEAGRRQSDNRWTLAMLRERGQLALDHGDRKTAEAAWGQMLETILVGDQKKKSVDRQQRPTAPRVPAPPASPPRTSALEPEPRTTTAQVHRAAYSAQDPVPARQVQTRAPAPSSRAARATGQPAPAGKENVPLLTLDRFEQAMQVAKLAAANNLIALSTRAVLESLKGGPPVVLNPVQDARRARVVMRNRGQEEPRDPVTPRVVAQLTELEAIWQRGNAPAELIFETLRQVVLPAARPAEVFLYAQPISQSAALRPRSVGAILASWACKASRAEMLAREVEARQQKPLAQLPASVLLVQLALAAGRDAQASSYLQAIADRLKRDTLRSSAELALHAALPALDRKDIHKAALVVLDAGTRGFDGPSTQEPRGSLLLLLARNEFAIGDTPAGRKRLGEYLDLKERSLGDYYGGDDMLYQRKEQLKRVAVEFARADLWSDTLDWLGRFVDAPACSGGDPPAGLALSLLVGQLTAKPAKDRYEALKTWTLPTPSRRMVRLLAALDQTEDPPACFGIPRASQGSPGKVRDGAALISTTSSLIDAATEAGTIDELAREAGAAAAAKIENGDVLSLLVELARGREEAVKSQIESRLATLIQENSVSSQSPAFRNKGPGSGGQKAKGFPWPDYLVARGALAARSRDVRELGLRLLEALVEHAQRHHNSGVLARLHHDLAVERARPLLVPAISLEAANGAALWHPASYRSPITTRESAAPSLWIAHQGHAAHISGPEQDMLIFDYPLEGNFEISCEAPCGSWQEAACSYAGVVAEPFWVGASSQVFPVGASETLVRPWNLSRMNDFNNLTIQVSPAAVRYLVNGYLYYEDKEPSPTSPWLSLFTRAERHTAWRGFSLKGTPTVPREVKLCVADRLEGWISSFYNETQPLRRTSTTTDRFGNAIAARRPARSASSAAESIRRRAVDPDEYDWSAQDGVIRGRRVMSASTVVNRNYGPDQELSLAAASESVLIYHRPLRDGDVLSYEFRYEPGQVMVHPALDRLAFLLEPGGVRLHWMTTRIADASGLPADNVADEPEARRGPKALPLKTGDWNTLKVAIAGDIATLELNGQLIFERRLAPDNSRQFGLFHDKERTSARVRNVVLKGRWPGQLSIQDRDKLVFNPDGQTGTEAERRARHAVIGESLFCRQAGEILASSRKLKPEESYTMLADWVLPSVDHPVFRLQGAFAPSDPIRSPAEESRANGSGKSKTEFSQARRQTGGTIEAPALELVDTAEKLGKLEELASVVARAAAEGEANERGKLALQTLISIARDDDAAAEKSLQELGVLVAKLGPGEPSWVSWPELVACARAIERPTLLKPALALLEPVITQAQTKSPMSTWERHVKNLRSRALVLSEPGGSSRPFGADADAPPWARVTHPRAETRGKGEPTPHWTFRDGQLNHFPGHGNDFMYLSIPLRGDFQLDCELTSFNWREIRVSYAGIAAALKYDLKHVERFHYGRSLPEVTLVPPFTKIGDWYPFRLVVKSGRMTTFADGRKIHETSLPAECDPWLAFFAQGHLAGSARKIRISGNPVIPERLNLTALPDLTGWLADYFGESVGVEDADWDKRGDEIYGRSRTDTPGLKQESVLRYNRPLLEDGEIEYEFYYEPGKTTVHPALDRLTFLLEPDGVKVHWLTDAQYERSGLKPENATSEPDNLRGPSSLPLKIRDWNRLSLSLAGDRVTLRLNQTEIYARTLESGNQRIFGLFHYADESDVRVRHVTYWGRWPGELPESLMVRQH